MVISSSLLQTHIALFYPAIGYQSVVLICCLLAGHSSSSSQAHV
jgi:hypothetical protein